MSAIKGLKEFLGEWAKNWSKGGLLARQGMVVAPDDIQAKNAKVVSDLTIMDASGLK